MAVCLPKKESDALLRAIRTGEITPEALIEMTSDQRRALFNDVVGPEMSKTVNELVESKLILKDYKAGLTTAIKQLTGIKEPVRRDLLKKVENMDKWLDPTERDLFLQDLASKRLGFEVTFDEANRLVELSKAIEESKVKVAEDSPVRSQERLDYGFSTLKFDDFANELKFGKKRPTSAIDQLGGVPKSVVASWDISFPGRQGLSVLFNNPTVWVRAVKDGFKAAAKGLKGDERAIAFVEADVRSRPNALNGKYKATKSELSLTSEEAFPSQLPGKIPILGRIFKGSEAHYNATALRMRADLTDLYIKMMEEGGVDILRQPDQAVAVGRLAGSMTGRGHLAMSESWAKGLNVLFFSPKFLKANFDLLTGHSFGYEFKAGPGRAIARRQAAKNLLNTVVGIATIKAIAEAMIPDSTNEWDVRSSDAGKIVVGGDTHIDVSGGLGGLATAASRLVPTQHNGEWGWWYKTATGKYIKMTSAEVAPFPQMVTFTGSKKYGGLTPGDFFATFISNKFAPPAAAVRDIARGEHFDGTPVTASSILLQNFTPIPPQTWQDLSDKDTADSFMFMLAEEIGFGVSVY